MAQKDRLRRNRYGTVINATSSKQELELGEALTVASEVLIDKFGLELYHQKKVMLKDIVQSLRKSFPTVEFGEPLGNTLMSPDGGIFSLLSREGEKNFPILITEF